MTRKEDADPADETVRLLSILVRLQVTSQKQAVIEMSRAGLSNARIAELLGTTPNTVNVTLQKVKTRAAVETDGV